MCIVNTSGSTGTPKGVVLNTRSFLDFIRWADERFAFDGSEIMGSLSPVVFDIFDFELVMLLVHGTELVLLDAFLAAFPAKLLQAGGEGLVYLLGAVYHGEHRKHGIARQDAAGFSADGLVCGRGVPDEAV